MINARSVGNKALEFKDMVVDNSVDRLAITETIMKQCGNDVITGELCPTGYQLVHNPRDDSLGLGVGLLF